MNTGYKSKEMKPIDEGMLLGDYPQLPWKSAQELPPRGWWDDQDRRNKEDPVILVTKCEEKWYSLSLCHYCKLF